MKIIQLLNKTVNGEEVPLKIEYNGEVYNREKNKSNGLYYYEVLGQGKFLIKQLSSVGDLLDEVEILDENEEKGLPEKITMRAALVGDIDNKIENLDINIMAVEDKLNEILDYLEKKSKEE